MKFNLQRRKFLKFKSLNTYTVQNDGVNETITVLNLRRPLSQPIRGSIKLRVGDEFVPVTALDVTRISISPECIQNGDIQFDMKKKLIWYHHSIMDISKSREVWLAIVSFRSRLSKERNAMAHRRLEELFGKKQ
jgi:hypothetical protein